MNPLIIFFVFSLGFDTAKTDTPSKLSVKAASVPVLDGSKLWLVARPFSGTNNAPLRYQS
jgi:hypothetical protein